MFKSFGIWEIVLILVIILIIFGVGKLPQVSSAIGKGIRSFKKAQAGEDEEDEKRKKETAAASQKDSTDNKAEKS
jgi:sec-independent protein translocase protein TatA